METRQAAFRAPVYISSVNAISVDGDIVNIDATGNRVAAISFGPEDVYFIIGKNKITDDCDCPDRICRNFVVFQRKPIGARYHVILINENLGY